MIKQPERNGPLSLTLQNGDLGPPPRDCWGSRTSVLMRCVVGKSSAEVSKKPC